MTVRYDPVTTWATQQSPGGRLFLQCSTSKLNKHLQYFSAILSPYGPHQNPGGRLCLQSSTRLFDFISILSPMGTTQSLVAGVDYISKLNNNVVRDYVEFQQ